MGWTDVGGIIFVVVRDLWRPELTKQVRVQFAMQEQLGRPAAAWLPPGAAVEAVFVLTFADILCWHHQVMVQDIQLPCQVIDSRLITWMLVILLQENSGFFCWLVNEFDFSWFVVKSHLHILFYMDIWVREGTHNSILPFWYVSVETMLTIQFNSSISINTFRETNLNS